MASNFDLVVSLCSISFLIIFIYLCSGSPSKETDFYKEIATNFCSGRFIGFLHNFSPPLCRAFFPQLNVEAKNEGKMEKGKRCVVIFFSSEYLNIILHARALFLGLIFSNYYCTHGHGDWQLTQDGHKRHGARKMGRQILEIPGGE